MNFASPSSPKVRLLVVDDEPAHMTALHHTLADAGYDVTAVPWAPPDVAAGSRETTQDD